jgi:hypothetical protein
MFLWVAQNVCNVVVLRVRSSSFQIRPSGKSIISISRTHTTFEQQDQALHHIFDSTIQDIKMAYMTQSAAAAFTMFLALASNVYITFVLQGYIYYKFGPRNIACIIASHSITLLCRFIYRKLSGEQRVDPVFKTMLNWLPGFVALYGLNYVHSSLERKAGCSFR